MREKPKLIKEEVKHVHFEMGLKDYLEFEKKVYSKGIKITEFFKNKALEELKND